MPRAGVDLDAELSALAEAAAAALARLERGDEAGMVMLIERRERLLRALDESPREASTNIMERARRALARDAELIEALRIRQVEIDRQIEGVAHARRSLMSYGATRPGSAVYVERFG
jgi:hypothetical protein